MCFGYGSTGSHKISCWAQAGIRIFSPLQATSYNNWPDKTIKDDVAKVDNVEC